MANTPNSNITPQAAVLKHTSLAAVTACTTRGPTALAGLAAANIVVCIPTVASDCKISKIALKGISTSMTAPTAAQLVGLWDCDGTTAYMVKEIVVSVITPSTTAIAFELDTLYDDMVLPSGHSLYVSTTITTTASTTALMVTAHGATF
jgi:hypothetical protein